MRILISISHLRIISSRIGLIIRVELVIRIVIIISVTLLLLAIIIVILIYLSHSRLIIVPLSHHITILEHRHSSLAPDYLIISWWNGIVICNIILRNLLERLILIIVIKTSIGLCLRSLSFWSSILTII